MFSSNTTQTSGGYEISRSLRFNEPDSTYLNRGVTSTGNRRTYTFSAWVKRSKTGTDSDTIIASMPSGGQFRIFFETSTYPNQLRLFSFDGSFQFQLITTQVFRDFSAWGHLVVAIDTTQATAANRVRVYWNGVEITSFGTATYPTQNADLQFNQAGQPHSIGATYNGSSALGLYNGYITEFYFVDGQALTPSSFGETNAQTGVWQPKAYSGSYGTNGFYVNFSDNSNTTATTLGKDYSGNGNNWTPNNFSVTAGVGNDSFVDSPTSYGTTDTGVGGEIRGNYCTLNALAKGTNTTLSNGNLQAYSTTTWSTVVGTIGVTTGKWYWEYTASSPGFYFACGMATSRQDLNSYLGDSTYGWNYRWDGQKQTNGVASSYGASFGNTDVIGVAFDADAGTLVFYKNGTSQGTAFTGLTSGPYFPATTGYNNEMAYANFGQRPFAYTAPSGYKALCTQNLPTPTIGATTATQANQFFTPVLYTGDGTNNRTISAGMTPDWTWIKERGRAGSHFEFDTLRGTGVYLSTNQTGGDNFAGSLGWTNSGPTTGGFKVDVGTNDGINYNTGTYVAWNWKANGSGSTNTAGSITSTVSANTTSGFSIVTYAGNSTASTIGHGLGVAPSMIIVKNRTTNNPGAWTVYHASLGNTTLMFMNTADAAYTGQGAWNSTSPTSSVFSVGSGTLSVNNTGNNFVAYCFAEVAGYSKFGSYTGNGSADGVFVYTGFKPAFILVKAASGTNAGVVGWWIFDGKRPGYNVTSMRLSPNTSDAEASNATIVDFTSNGFKWRDASGGWNDGAITYIYMALAENPFKYSLAR